MRALWKKTKSFAEGMFELRGTLSKTQNIIIGSTGFLLIIWAWHLITAGNEEMQALLPPPDAVYHAFGELYSQDYLLGNSTTSIIRNFNGYYKAVIYAIPIGFMIGLFPIFRALFAKYVDAIRFIPLAATTGIFIIWYGIDEEVKVNFLAFGIFVYLLPIVVQRIDGVEKVYMQTSKTMGASKWQTIRTVFIPAVFSRVFDDIRVIVAISWTYIVIAELINNQGGLGVMLHTAARQSRIDKVFAILLVIVLIGILQDQLFKWLDRLIFPYKYTNRK
jgi:NitT/TauT family transport system permease protein